MSAISAYLLVFAASFLAATVLPLYSEAVLAVQLARGHHSWGGLIAAAAIGNVLGSVVNYGLGRWLRQYQDARWFPFKAPQMARAEAFFHRYGTWTLLLAWVPIVGDPLTFVAGTLNTRFLLFLSLVAIGKTARYLAISWLI